MKIKRSLIFTICLSLWFSLHSINAQPYSSVGTRSLGMAGTSACLSGVESVQGNQAGLASLQSKQASISYLNRFCTKELSTKSCAFALPTSHGTLGLGISWFGFKLFSQQKFNLAYAKSFGENFSMGISLDYLATVIPEYENQNSFLAEFGISAKPFPKIILGAHLFNPTGSRLAKYGREKIPTLIQMGVAYIYSEKILLLAEVEKDIEKKTGIKTGIEYSPIKELYLRIGYSTQPSAISFGVGLLLKEFNIAIASSYHPLLGISSQLGLTYSFDKLGK